MALDIIKLIGGSQGLTASKGMGGVPVRVVIAFDPSVNKGIKDVAKGVTIGLIALGVGIGAKALFDRRRR